MDSDKRKEYNKKYYADNKATICGKLAEKEACIICGKEVNHQNITRHQMTKKCIGKAKQLAAKEDSVENLKKQVEDVQNKLNMLNVVSDPLMYCWGCQASFPESEKSKHKCDK